MDDNDIRVNCPSCGWKRPRLVNTADGHSLVKCPTCGLNTGPKKSAARAVNAWNAMGQRMK